MNGNSVKSMKIRKKEATEFLNKRGRRIELILVSIMLLFAAVAPLLVYFYVGNIFITLYNGLNLNVSGTIEEIISIAIRAVACIFSLLLVIFVTLPTYSGFFNFSYKLYRKGIADGIGNFGSNNGYFRAISSGGVIYGVLFLSLVPVVLLVDLGNLLYDFLKDTERINKLLNSIKIKEISDLLKETIFNESVASVFAGVFFLVIVVGLVLGFLVFLLFKPLFLFAYFTARGEKSGSAIKLSRERMRSARAKKLYGSYITSFLPALLLSVVSLLTLFLIDTLPKMTVVYFEIADEIVYGE